MDNTGHNQSCSNAEDIVARHGAQKNMRKYEQFIHFHIVFLMETPFLTLCHVIDLCHGTVRHDTTHYDILNSPGHSVRPSPKIWFLLNIV